MSVAYACSSERQASNPRPPGNCFATSRPKRPARSRLCTCMCNKRRLRCLQLQVYLRRQPERKALMTELKSAVAMAPSRRFGTLAEDLRVTRTAAALEANGISVVRAATAADAKQVVLGLIPDGCQVHQGASLSLEAAGI